MNQNSIQLQVIENSQSGLNKYEAYFSHSTWIPKVGSSEQENLWKPLTISTIFLLYCPLLVDFVFMFSKWLLHSLQASITSASQEEKKREV